MDLLQNMRFFVTVKILPIVWFRIIMPEMQLLVWKSLQFGISIFAIFPNRSLKNELERLIQTIIMQ